MSIRSESRKSFSTSFANLYQRFLNWKFHRLVLGFLYFLLLYALYFIFAYQEGLYHESQYYGFNSFASEIVFSLLIAVFAVSLVVSWFVLKRKKRLKLETISFHLVLISMSIVVLFSYFRFMNTNSFKHDYALFSEGGHWAIIYDIYNDGVWPPVNLDNQYYQPKIWHTIIASFMRFNSLFLPVPINNSIIPNLTDNLRFSLYTFREYQLLETSRILIAFYGSLTIYFIYKIFYELGFRERPLLIISLLLSFTPIFWYMPYYGNNDSLSFFFGVLALYFAVRYRNKKSFLDIVLTGFFLGLSMATKLNNAIIALPIAFIFLLELIEVIKERKNIGRFIGQIFLFAVIVFPVGLAVPLYNNIVYGEPFGYVLNLEADGNWNFMHIDSNVYNPLMRFLLFPTPDAFFSIFNLRYHQSSGFWQDGIYMYNSVWGEQDFNVWTAFLKTTLWGESSYAVNDSVYFLMCIFYGIAFLVGLLFVISLLTLTIYYLLNRHNGEEGFRHAFFLIVFFVSALSYCYFSYKYPVGCSMNARYASYLYIPIYGCTSVLIDKTANSFAKRKIVHS